MWGENETKQNNHVRNVITTTNWIILLKEKVSSRYIAANFSCCKLIALVKTLKSSCNSTKCLLHPEFGRTTLLGRNDCIGQFWCPTQVFSPWFCTAFLVMAFAWEPYSGYFLVIAEILHYHHSPPFLPQPIANDRPEQHMKVQLYNH